MSSQELQLKGVISPGRRRGKTGWWAALRVPGPVLTAEVEKHVVQGGQEEGEPGKATWKTGRAETDLQVLETGAKGHSHSVCLEPNWGREGGRREAHVRRWWGPRTQTPHTLGLLFAYFGVPESG